MARKSGLGERGLSMLLSSAAEIKDDDKDGELKQLPVDKVQRGEYQPRVHIDPVALQELAESIKAQGLIQPIVVRRIASGRYELIAGERRWRAAQMAGLHEIPALIRAIPDQAAAAMSLIENIQREDLNPLEESQALQRLIDEFGLTHQQTADAVGRSRSAITNLLRLLELEPEVRGLVETGQLNMGHARALLALKDKDQLLAAKTVVDRQLSVRATEALVKQLVAGSEQITDSALVDKKAPEVLKLEQSLSEKLGAGVNIQYNTAGKGRLVIEYNSLDELDGILGHIQ